MPNASISQWTAGFSRRGALAPPSAGPATLFRSCHQTSFHRIPFNVPRNAIKLTLISNDPIIIFFLPELLSPLCQDPIGQKSRRSLNPSNKLRNRNRWRTQQVDVIGHNNEGVQCTEPIRIDFSQLLLYDTGDLSLPQIERTKSCCVEQPVERYELLAGCNVIALESSFPWQATSKAPSDKCRHPRSVNMRQPPTITSHLLWCGNATIILKKSCGAEAPRRLKPALQINDNDTR